MYPKNGLKFKWVINRFAQINCVLPGNPCKIYVLPDETRCQYNVNTMSWCSGMTGPTGDYLPRCAAAAPSASSSSSDSMSEREAEQDDQQDEDEEEGQGKSPYLTSVVLA